VLIIRIKVRFNLQINSKLIAGFVEPTYLFSRLVSRRYFRISVAITAMTRTPPSFQFQLLREIAYDSARQQRKSACSLFEVPATSFTFMKKHIAIVSFESFVGRRKAFLLLRRFCRLARDAFRIEPFLLTSLLAQFCALRVRRNTRRVHARRVHTSRTRAREFVECAHDDNGTRDRH